MPKETAIHFSNTLRMRWPNPLATEWKESYPALFDDEDLRLAQSQPKNHFCEWLAAIHFYQRDGALSLIEKYGFQKHARKAGIVEKVLSPAQRECLGLVKLKYGIQPPDLLLYKPDYSKFWFAEIKGPGDKHSQKQRESHRYLEKELGIIIEQVTVKSIE